MLAGTSSAAPFSCALIDLSGSAHKLARWMDQHVAICIWKVARFTHEHMKSVCIASVTDVVAARGDVSHTTSCPRAQSLTVACRAGHCRVRQDAAVTTFSSSRCPYSVVHAIPRVAQQGFSTRHAACCSTCTRCHCSSGRTRSSQLQGRRRSAALAHAAAGA